VQCSIVTNHNEHINVSPLYSRTLFYIIKRIYDNNNYNCYQWIKSKCVRMVWLLLSVVDTISHVVSPAPHPLTHTDHPPPTHRNVTESLNTLALAHYLPPTPPAPPHQILRPLADHHDDDEFSNMTNLYGFPFRNGKSAAYGFLPYARPEIIAPVHTRRGLCQLKALSVHFTNGRPPLTSDPFTPSRNSTIVCL